MSARRLSQPGAPVLGGPASAAIIMADCAHHAHRLLYSAGCLDPVCVVHLFRGQQASTFRLLCVPKGHSLMTGLHCLTWADASRPSRCWRCQLWHWARVCTDSMHPTGAVPAFDSWSGVARLGTSALQACQPCAAWQVCQGLHVTGLAGSSVRPPYSLDSISGRCLLAACETPPAAELEGRQYFPRHMSLVQETEDCCVAICLLSALDSQSWESELEGSTERAPCPCCALRLS